MTTLDSSKVFEAKQKLRKLRPKGGIIALDRHVCQLIVDAGGPTFKSLAHRYFRCVQSGHKIRNCEAFRRLVFSKIAKGETVLKAYAYGFFNSSIRCPHCKTANSLEKSGIKTCWNCKERYEAVMN